jgi:hypothetical protein
LNESWSITDYLRVQAARRSFESAKARYVRARVAEAAAEQLRSLMRDRLSLTRACERMQAVLDLHEQKVTRAEVRFERELPGRVRPRGLERPTFLDRIATLGSSERLYREWRVWRFCREEVASDLADCRKNLGLLTQKIEGVVRSRTTLVERRLATPAGFRQALAHDGQLALAYARLNAIVDNGDNR